MIVDVLRFVAGRLADATTGVNALRSSVPKDVGDGTPAAVTIYTEADAPVTALGPVSADLLASGPVLLVGYVGTSLDVTDPHSMGVASTLVQVVVRYAAEQDSATAYARDGWQIVRCAIRALVGPSLTGAARLPSQSTTTRNRVAIDAPRSVTLYAPPPGSAAEAFVPALVATIPARDAWAWGG